MSEKMKVRTGIILNAISWIKFCCKVVVPIAKNNDQPSKIHNQDVGAEYRTPQSMIQVGTLSSRTAFIQCYASDHPS